MRDAPPPMPPPRPAAPRPEMSDAAVVSRSWGMALATLVSRLTGFARIVLLAAILGAALSSAFTVANQLPNMIAALVLEATFTAIFVPVLARAERDDPDGGTAFIRRLLTLATALLLTVTLISTVAAPLLVDLMLGSDPLVDRSLTTAFAYLLLPQIIFYGLNAVFMAILNTRNVFGPPAWAPVVNNIVAIATLGLYVVVPGELSLNPVEMGDAKLLVLGIGTTLGVVAQASVLFVAIRRERVSLRPLWGIDARLKKFGMMAVAMVLYVLISQVGFIVGNQVASAAAASGPAIYNYTWLILQLPFGIVGVTVLTVVMPRLSRNAAAENGPAVLADLSLATRLTMVTLIPIVAMMTVGGPAIGSALFSYGNFGAVDAGYLGVAITLSSFTLIPYALVLLQLRVFYAREEPWTPILLIVVITIVKVAASLAAPHVTDNPDLVAGYLGLANGLGFLAGATVGYLLLRARLDPPGGRLLDNDVIRTILVTITASLAAGLIAHVVDQLLGLENLTNHWGAGGSLLRLVALGLVMVPIIVGIMLAAKVPDARSAVAAVQRRLGRRPQPVTPPVRDMSPRPLTYADRSDRPPPSRGQLPRSVPRGPRAEVADDGRRRGSAVSDKPTGDSSPDPDSTATTRFVRPGASDSESTVHPDDFQPDVPDIPETVSDDSATTAIPTANPAVRPPSDYGGDPTREALAFDPPREPAIETATAADEVHLIPGATVSGRYRLLVAHGGPEHLQFWQALDTALDRPVALTFVDPDGTMSDSAVQEILDRTQRLSRIDMPGVARVLDVVKSGTGGLVVSEWIRGGSLAEVAETNPSPIGGARAIQSLAAAAEVAHRNGVALSIDHPSRIRVSIDGDVALAFPATLSSASPDDDIRGIGAALYALLVDKWPLPEAGDPSGLAQADLDAAGQPVEPRSVDRDIPFQISAAAARAVQEGGGIRSAPTLLNLLQQATAIADRTDHIAPVSEPAPETRGAGTDSGFDQDADPDADARRRKGVVIGLTVAGAIVIVAVVLLATVLSRIFGDVGNGLGGDELGLNAPSSTEAESPSGTGSAIKPVRATVFSPEGEADAPELAPLAIDGNPTTVWPIDTYTDPVPFPNFKNGVGLMLQLSEPATIGSVTINLNSTGTSVQIRSSDSATPSSLDATTALTEPTPLKPGSNTIEVEDAEATSNVLVWVTTLGKVGGESRSDIAEVTLNAKS
ncbi:murein biosynthesis integral membrane protein MurJ [Mycobacterium sp. 236(2023)]|uniref:murein biosynthesis integral membrane protein MurJ n=1 Tax=Mycobacterium sp. 236(2023) TaxID=3038163 RepID=UPI00241579EF|nr:murein biosynthesis integral membrane protein MurJ [Mycobacterium sp. 236(2023)]MDG4667314.1 murein biosynthesis integral membrane protein MurJ [Mycobacterium sp. 236(2023)]